MLTGPVSKTLALTGASAASSAGSFTLAVAVTLTGVSSVGSAGSVTTTGSLAITEPADTVAFAGHIGDIQEPPWLAEFLLGAFARTRDIEALMGDFEEHFTRDCARMSQRRANVRYWSLVVRSIGPQFWQFIRRVGLLGLIAAVLRR